MKQILVMMAAVVLVGQSVVWRKAAIATIDERPPANEIIVKISMQFEELGQPQGGFGKSGIA